MELDDYITGTFDDNAPFNQKDEDGNDPNELELITDELAKTKQRLDYKTFQLQRLAQFESIIVTHGSLTYEEQTEKNEILKQYL